MSAWLRRHRTALLVYAAALVAFCAASGRRIARPSPAPHYVYLADGFLHGRLSLSGNPPNDNDWARVETLRLKDGRTVRGQFSAGSSTTFVTTQRETLTLLADQIASRKADWYVAFPPFPAVLLMPAVAIAGLRTNDVLFTILLAAFVPALLVGLLRRLRELGLSRRTEPNDLWLVALFALGSVFYYSSVIGQVWYLGHVVFCAICVLYAWASLEARHPLWAGLLLGLGVATRGPSGLMLFPLLVLEAWRCRRLELGRVLTWFAAPAALVGVLLACFNWARFGNPLEFGYSYFVIRWSGRIQHWGLFNFHFLSRNLAAAFTLTPKFINRSPFVQLSRHGLSLLITTPSLAYLLWPKERPILYRAVWVTALLVSVPTFFYQSDGYVQFGYRYSLDFMVFLVMLLAMGARPLTRTFRGLILAGIVVNLIGAITFNELSSRMWFDPFFPAE
jgi:hypothetical protein